MTESLSASDMSSLLAERGPIHVNVGGTAIFEGDPPAFARLLEHVQARLDLVPRFRRKVTAVPTGLFNPVWADDPNFDLRWHVRHSGLPRPGSEAQLRDLVGRVMSEPLDLARPLWQIYVIEGLERNRFAVISKTHHALVDGVSAVDVGTILLDVHPEGTQLPPPERPWEPDAPSPSMLLMRSASQRLRAPLGVARRATLGAVTSPRETAARLRKTAEGFRSLATSAPRAEPSAINVDIGRDRRVAFVKTDLASIKAARGTRGATFNDVVLACAAGALRRYLSRRGSPLPRHLVALVPVSLRRADEQLELGNRISTIFARLPMDEPDPARLLERIRAETSRLKQSEQTRAASLVIEATGWAPPTINRVIAAAMSRPLTWNLVVSTVPGPQMPVYLLGRRLAEIYPFVPLSPQGRALSIGVVSFDDRVCFGITGDRDALHDLDDLAAALEESIVAQTAVQP